MNWLTKLELLDYGAFVKDEKALVVSDLQLGYEKYLQKTGVTVPRNQFSKTLLRLERMAARTRAEKLIIAGDVQHDFQRIDFETLSSVRKLVRALERRVKKIVFVKGNHDTMLEPVLKRMGYELFDQHETKDFVIVHGHKKVSAEKVVIMGHEHPAISLKDEFGQKHKYKCHLLGKKILVIPSISALASGTIVNEEAKPLSPMLKSYDNLKPVVNGLTFPEIRKLRQVMK